MIILADFANAILKILLEASPYLLFGFVVAGIVKAFIPMDMVRTVLGKRGSLSVIKASLIGAPLPLCSCSVLPAALSLREKGADKGAVSAFLVSTPETGPDSIAITYALLDPLMTIFRPIAAFLTAIFAGFAELLFNSKDDAPIKDIVTACCNGENSCNIEKPLPSSFNDKIAEGFRYAFVDLMDDIAGWMIVGLILAGLVTVLFPDNFIAETGLSDWVMMPIMMVIGIPMYICATSSTPLAAAFILKGLSPGAALVFLLSGPATNIGSLMVIRKQLGAKFVTIYLLSIFVSSVLLGLLLNNLYPLLNIEPSALTGTATEIFPLWFEIVSAIIFMSAAMWALLKKNFRK